MIVKLTYCLGVLFIALWIWSRHENFLYRTYKIQATKAIHFIYRGKWLYKNLALNKQKVNGSTISAWLAHLFYSLQNYKNIYSDYILCFLKLLPANDANAQLVLGRKFSSIIQQLRHLQSIHLNSDNVLTRLHLLRKKCFSPNLAKPNLHYHYIISSSSWTWHLIQRNCAVSVQ